MAKQPPLTDQDLFEIETLACDATPGPWEAQTVLDFQTGESMRVVAHATPAGDEYVYVVERDGEVSEEDQRFIATMHPDAALRLVREIRRLRRVEERYQSLCSVLQHLNTFLERRGLVSQAQRFVEVRAQLERIHPESLEAGAPGTAPAPAAGRARPVSAV
ncbi:hypothetical protein [Longimicrobium sp.]|uniref:hypothetical protein n=1 Tax=Longimicrobium sp. TaxID=2029185 RepID=UPI002BAFB9C9|nr:hypothetical protein [Longimicrobium sp.]HSU15068.1 hypothetical protein [Longimicrobium sp.]